MNNQRRAWNRYVYPSPDRELTVAEKWAEVDGILEGINNRRLKGIRPCQNYLEHYIDDTFNLNKPASKGWQDKPRRNDED